MTEDKKSRILLVDDEESLRRTLGDYLEFHGYEVERAKNGEDGLKRLAQFKPDLIILDMAMPGMGGVSFIREIMDEAGQPRYPVLVLTARSVMKEFFDGISVHGFIPKPSSEKKILREIERVLAGVRESTERRNADGRKTVLVCEDDGNRMHELITVFGQAGYSAKLVKSGPEALQQTMTMKPDAVVIKEVFTGMNGSKVAGLLSAMSATHEIPVILYDATRNLQDSTLLSTGATTGVHKKLWTNDPFVILQAVNEALAADGAESPSMTS